MLSRLAAGGWLVTGRELAIQVMRDAATFTVDDPRFSTAQVIGRSMLSTDGAEHDRHRTPFAGPFGHAAVQERFGGWVSSRARELVAVFAADGRAELRSGIAAPLATDVMVEVLGLSAVDPGSLLDWYEAIVGAVDEITVGDEPTSAGLAAYQELEAAVAATVAAGGDTLLATVARNGTLTDAEIASNAAVLLFGGIVTSEGATASALHHLLTHPDQLDAVRADRLLVADAVEESLRLEPPAAAVDRYATGDTDLDGVLIGRGDLVRVSIAGANRDPARFPDPDRFDVHRRNAQQHVTFARGPHACLGIHLARLETRAAVDAVLDLLPGLRLDADASTPPRGLIFRKPHNVVATWG